MKKYSFIFYILICSVFTLALTSCLASGERIYNQVSSPESELSDECDESNDDSLSIIDSGDNEIDDDSEINDDSDSTSESGDTESQTSDESESENLWIWFY